MNGIHDMGGMQCMGPVVREANEPPFHEAWEGRVFGTFMSAFAGGVYNIDEFRHAIERMPPAHYLETSYYEHWLHAIETLSVEKGVLTRDEIAARMAALAAATPSASGGP